MFFIYNCNGEKRGNLKGYKTQIGAQRVLNTVNSKVSVQVWREYYQAKEQNPKQTRVYCILGESLTPENVPD
jgi:hypothetical protein